MGGSSLLRSCVYRRLLYNGHQAAQRWASNTDRGSGKEEDIASLLEGAEVDREDPEKPQPSRSPSDSSVVLFPGQGSQQVGMSSGLLKYPNVRAMFQTAHRVLGYDLLDLCLKGPPEMLEKTVHCQPAVFLTSLAAAEKLSQEDPEAVEKCVVTAGFSVGEFAALVFAGALDFTEALYAVKIRAEAMQEASDAVPSGMLSVVGTSKTKYHLVCAEAEEHCKTLGIAEPVCKVANFLFPNGRVIAGHMEAIQFLQKNSKKFSFSRTKLLPVSGAFHTPLMEPAVEPLRNALKTLSFKQPLINVYCNVDGKRYRHASAMEDLLAKQLVSPVKWEQTMHAIYERKQGTNFPWTFEMGPGIQLGTMLRICNLKAWKFYKNIDVFESDC
ncbi:malonyl-CoA-acyl carrier protein transacylase, mitochondrial [Bufo bufo]|uniref:malonyl-CoA-acyl carrier protein transacylase, mitochondrial n=1 Tax=Bufo bufo TaxID=8384 RepID=UPI001ABECCDC|nr:malonyl-CoA-acyl carrier protein transacylase, mitochondrial [Bufo bufo]